MSPAAIKLGLEATDWQDAIRQAAQPLREEGKIQQSYIEGIIRNMQEAGPYFVLAPAIALPHTRPEEGALATALGIATLKTPVDFGSPHNDPVKYLFCLSATDQASHLEALAELSALLEDEAFFRLLDEAKQPQEIMDFLNNQQR